MATERQKRVFQKILEKPRPIGTVMREEGYSENTIVDPQNLTKSKGWKELMEQYLPDDKLAKKHDQLLEHEEGNIQVKALDMAYKLKGSYAPDKSVNITANIDVDPTNPEAKKLTDEYEAKLKEAFIHEAGPTIDTRVDSTKQDQE
jgi:divalent metal cation (Fe/Co/Zn/Cd) transporter